MHSHYGMVTRRTGESGLAEDMRKNGVVLVAWQLVEDRKGYARELAKLADKLGADHVAIGTDIEGVGRNWTVNDYGHVRAVVEPLQAMQLPDSVVERIAYANYARVLKAALKG
jgi:microsomal dipeptidase-like Zn-dependent dipeptidase